MIENKLTNSETQLNETNTDNSLLNARKKSLQQLKSNTQGDFSWLTDHSRKFLASGYLTDGVSAEERIREIAERAEQILGIPGYADKFFNYMSLGYYSLSSPVWSNFGKQRGLTA